MNLDTIEKVAAAKRRLMFVNRELDAIGRGKRRGSKRIAESISGQRLAAEREFIVAALKEARA